MHEDRKTVMTLEEIIAVAKGALKEEDAELMEKVAKVLDYDKDGLIDVEEVRHVFAYLEEEGSNIKMADISRVLELVHAEEEVEELEAESELKEQSATHEPETKGENVAEASR
jgi:Ca2+-binding EF-hand superfamily protein